MPARPKPKATPEVTYTPSTLPADHFLVRLGAPQGSNQFATEINGESKLVDMPARVRRLSFAARGSFAIVQLYPASEAHERVAGEIVHVVTGTEAKTWRRTGEWPKEFDDAVAAEQAHATVDDESDDSLPDNPNRRRVARAESSSDEESDDE